MYDDIDLYGSNEYRVYLLGFKEVDLWERGEIFYEDEGNLYDIDLYEIGENFYEVEWNLYEVEVDLYEKEENLYEVIDNLYEDEM